MEEAWWPKPACESTGESSVLKHHAIGRKPKLDVRTDQNWSTALKNRAISSFPKPVGDSNA